MCDGLEQIYFQEAMLSELSIIELLMAGGPGRMGEAELYNELDLPRRPSSVPNGKLSRSSGSSVFDRLYKQAFSGTYSSKFQR